MTFNQLQIHYPKIANQLKILFSFDALQTKHFAFKDHLKTERICLSLHSSSLIDSTFDILNDDTILEVI
jgi:hypothetical protein